MQLKYVGAKPIVLKSGVSFDQTKPDKYTFIGALLEILAAFEELGVDESGVLDIDKWKGRPFGDKELADKAAVYCKDIDRLSKEVESRTNALIDGYVKKLEESKNLGPDEKRAWLGNISMMKAYYLQYISNEFVYDCLLDLLAEKVINEKVTEIVFPLYRNYGLVLSHLIPVLTDHRPPIDATLTIEEKNGETYGKFDTNRPRAAI